MNFKKKSMKMGIIKKTNLAKSTTKTLTILQVTFLMNLLCFSKKQPTPQVKASLKVLLILLYNLILLMSHTPNCALIRHCNSTNSSSKANLKETHMQMNRWTQLSPTTR
jgi:predicted acyltransferase